MSDRSLKVTIGGDVGPLDQALRRGSSSLSVFVNQASTSGIAAGVAIGGIGLKAVGMAADVATSIGKAGLSFAQWGVGLAAEAEQAEIAFGVMLGSTDKAKTLLGDLASFAASTPFELPGLRDAAKSLLAFGVPAKEMIPTMRAIGDVASGLNIPLGDLAEIYGKAKVAGRLMSDDINQLSGRGVPIITLLAKQFGVAEGEVKKLVEGGKVQFSHLEQAFVDMTATGGQFAGMMEKQSASVLGKWSTLTDGVTQLATGVGKIILEEFGFSDLISDGGTVLAWLQENMLPTVRTVFRAMGQAVIYVTNYVRELGADALSLASNFEPAIETIRELGKTILSVQAGVQAMAGDSAGVAATGIKMAQLEMLDSDQIRDTMLKQANELRRPIQETWKEMIEGLAKDMPAPKIDPTTLADLAKSRKNPLADAAKAAGAGALSGLGGFIDLVQGGSLGKNAMTTASAGPAGLDVGGREAFAAIQARERDGDRQTDLAKQQLVELKTISKAVAKDATKLFGKAEAAISSFFAPGS